MYICWKPSCHIRSMTSIHMKSDSLSQQIQHPKHLWHTWRWHTISKLIFRVEPLWVSNRTYLVSHYKSLRLYLGGTPIVESHIRMPSFHYGPAQRIVFSRLIVGPSRTTYTRSMALESFLTRGCWFSSSIEEVKFIRLIAWPSSYLRKTHTCFAVVSLLVSSEPSTPWHSDLWWI